MGCSHRSILSSNPHPHPRFPPGTRTGFSWCREGTFLLGKPTTRFLAETRGQRALPTPAASHGPAAQRNQHATAASLGRRVLNPFKTKSGGGINTPNVGLKHLPIRGSRPVPEVQLLPHDQRWRCGRLPSSTCDIFHRWGHWILLSFSLQRPDLGSDWPSWGQLTGCGRGWGGSGGGDL